MISGANGQPLFEGRAALTPDWTPLFFDAATSLTLNGGSVAADGTGRGLSITLPDGVAQADQSEGTYVCWDAYDACGLPLDPVNFTSAMFMLRELVPPSLTSDIIVFGGWVGGTDLGADQSGGGAIIYTGGSRTLRVFRRNAVNFGTQDGGADLGIRRVFVSHNHAGTTSSTASAIRANGLDDEGNYLNVNANVFTMTPGARLRWFLGAYAQTALGEPTTIDVQGFGLGVSARSGFAPT